MSYPPYRALQIVLGFLSLLMVAGGVLLIFSSKLLIAHPPVAAERTVGIAFARVSFGST